VIIILIPPEVLRNAASGFLRQLSSLLRSNVRLLKDENGRVMIHAWTERDDVDEGIGDRKRRSVHSGEADVLEWTLDGLLLRRKRADLSGYDTD